MRVSRFLLTTLKEAPAEAELVSHRLMLRTGMIKRLAAGIYTWMPLGLRVLRKVEAIVREEMNRSGAIELLMPVVQPAEMWQESGRWDRYGKELLRFKDRNDREFCFGPTHEEVISALVRGEVRSWRQLPLNLYQIQSKFRDEVRPRFQRRQQDVVEMGIVIGTVGNVRPPDAALPFEVCQSFVVPRPQLPAASRDVVRLFKLCP